VETTTKGERTRSLLLDIAVARFGANGFRATSVSEIARAAGVTQAAVYAYFRNKEALFEAAVDSDAEALVQDAEALVDPALPARDRLVGMLLHLTSGLDGHPLTHRVLGGQEPEVINRLLTLPVLQRLEAGLTIDLEEARAAGGLRADTDPAVLAEGIVTVVLSLLMARVQVGEATTQLKQGAVLAVFDAVLQPWAE
jgi:AcrR family transcriptional regulator